MSTNISGYQVQDEMPERVMAMDGIENLADHRETLEDALAANRMVSIMWNKTPFGLYIEDIAII